MLCSAVYYNIECYIISLIVLLAKWHIHKCRCNNQNSFFLIFKNEVKQYIKTKENLVN